MLYVGLNPVITLKLMNWLERVFGWSSQVTPIYTIGWKLRCYEPLPF